MPTQQSQCLTTPEILLLLFPENLEAARREHFSAHLKQCDKCRRKLAEFDTTLAVLRTANQIDCQKFWDAAANGERARTGDDHPHLAECPQCA